MAIDLRSDTVTRPTVAMRQAMMDAPVGDDVLGDDPTVIALQERVAALLGKDAALFTPTGTMANQLALRAQTQPGDEVLVDDTAHIATWESGAGAALSGVQFRSVPAPRGGFSAADVEPRLRPDSYMAPRSSLIAVENTNNHRGGEIYDIERLRELGTWANERSIRLHMDGARLWNASVASGISLRDYAAPMDSISLCFSKGLGAPLGSILVSDARTIKKAHRFRKMFGGGMRQAGLVAGAALYALDNHVDRLQEDHRNARILGEAASAAPGLELLHPVDTNIVIIGVQSVSDSPEALVTDLHKHGVQAIVWEERSIRMVTHLDVTTEQVESAGQLLQRIRA